jgi:hypothetical protein
MIEQTLASRRKLPWLCVLLLVMGVAYPEMTCQAQDIDCKYWQSKVDPRITLPQTKAREETGDEQVLQAIECLLKLQGRKDESKLRGATKLTVSQGFGPASVEVAALYYISYLYFQKWDHGSAIALRDAKGEVDKPAAVAQAYKSYKRWFKRVKSVGLTKAREMDLRPLSDTRVRWY